MCSMKIGAGLLWLTVLAGCARAGQGRGGSAVAPVVSTIASSAAVAQLDAIELLPPGELSLAGDGRGVWLSQQIAVDGFFADASNRDVTHEASLVVADPGVARVSADGLVTAVGRGVTRLTVAMRRADGSTLRAERAIRVDDTRGLPGKSGATPTQLELYPSSRALVHVNARAGVDQTQQLVAVLVYSDGAREDVTRSVPFLVLDPRSAGGARTRSAAASVSPSGVLRAIQDGETVDVRAGIPERDLVAGSRFLLGRTTGVIGTPDLYLGDPLAGSPNPLDRAALGAMRRQGVEPSPLSSDSEFLRRVTADVVGRLPGERELAAFEQDRSPDKRARAIDALLATNDFAAHWASDVVATWVGLKDDAFESALRDDLAQGMTLGTIAYRIAAGSGNPQSELPERARFDAAFTVNVGRERPSALMMGFAGMSVRCAMCHDHKLNATWGHTRGQKLFSFFAENLGDAKLTNGTFDYGNPIEPDWDLGPLGGRPLPTLGPDPAATLQVRRARFGALLGESDAFFRGTAHRIWSELATPLLDPSRFLEENAATILQPAVLDALAAAFKGANGSLQGFLRVVLGSKLYQLTTAGVTTRKDTLLARQKVRRHNAETVERGTSSVTGDPAPFGASYFFLSNFGYPFARLLPMFPRMHAVNAAQPLTLQNSRVVQDRLTRPGNGIQDLAAQVDSRRISFDEAVRRIVRAALTRDPSAAELAAVSALTKGKNVATLEALEDVASAVMGSTEFVLR